MFELARVLTIGMTRRFDFARSALNFTDHTRFLFYICLFSNIELVSSFTICPYLLLKNFNALLGYNFTPNLHVICDAPSVKNRRHVK